MDDLPPAFVAAIDGQVHRINAQTFLFSPGHDRVEEL
jgi:hypothetical protein